MIDPNEGKLCIDVAKRTADPLFSKEKEKCAIILHGVTGNSKDEYMKEMAGHCVRNGYNVIALMHYAPINENNLRLMDFNKRKYIDEVI